MNESWVYKKSGYIMLENFIGHVCRTQSMMEHQFLY